MSIIFITLTNDGYLDYTLNCLKSLEKINLHNNLHCYCIGKEGHQRLLNNNYISHYIEDEEYCEFQTFMNEKWMKIMFKKFNIIYENLLKYDYVCYTDGDVVFENSNLLNYLLETIEDNELLIQNDSLSDSDDTNLCFGFAVIKSTPNTLNLFNPHNVPDFTNIQGWNDQIYINQIKNNLKYKLLPLELFPNGNYYYNKYDINNNPYMIHFNWVVGHIKKEKMINYNKWYLD